MSQHYKSYSTVSAIIPRWPNRGEDYAGVVIDALAEYLSESYFVVENVDTKEKIAGSVKDTIAQHMEWKRNGYTVTVTKVNKDTAETLYGTSKNKKS